MTGVEEAGRCEAPASQLLGYIGLKITWKIIDFHKDFGPTR